MGSYGHLVDNAKILLNSACNWEARHVKRFGNGDRFALSCNEELSWHLECPNCTQEVVLGEH